MFGLHCLFRRFTNARLLAPAVLALLGGLSSCTGSGPVPADRPIPGYDLRPGLLAGRDLSPLQHRRIVLDPGHGGRYRGAVGPNGLTEAEVNLGVALHLRGLLEWAGASVWLTRTADYDLLTPPDSSLVDELALRVSFTNSLQPDVFISIHHNSNAALDRTLNETQTYYPLDDDGAALDLARSIHRHLVANLGIAPASIRPGNFHVLREATVPAVLGEPAMISHPVMAERLSLAASQRLEAEAYLLGLLDYFSGGLPAWSGAALDTAYWGSPADPAVLSWRFLPAGQAAGQANGPATPGRLPGPDPTRIRLTLDGEEITPDLGPNALTVSWTLPTDLPPRPHRLELRGHNLLDRATPRRRTLLLPRAAADLVVDLTLPTGTGPAGLAWHGQGDFPLPTGTLRLPSGRTFAVGPELPAWHLVENLAVTDAQGPVLFEAATGDRQVRTCTVNLEHTPTGRQLRLVQLDGQPYAPAFGWRSRLGAGGRQPLVTLPDTGPVWLEGAGVLPLIDPAREGPAAAVPTGRTVDAAAPVWPVTPVLGTLLGKVIVLDPAGGGTNTDGTGPLGLRGADLNLAVARQTAALLTGAGARVHLTRTDESELPAVEKVRLAGRVGADLLLTIGRHAGTAPRTALYHPGSRLGRLWAQAAARASGLLPLAAGGQAAPCQVEESAAYLLRHTACPALEWRLDPPASPAGELRQVLPGWHRAEARAILLATVAVSGEPEVWDHLLDLPAILSDLAARGGLTAVDVDWAMLDGNLVWSPLPRVGTSAGPVESLDSDPGPGLPDLLPWHVLEIHAGPRWQVWRLDTVQTRRQATLLLGSSAPTP